MGAGASTATLPTTLDKAAAQQAAGDAFDEAAFDKVAKNGAVSRDEFLQAAAAFVPLAAADSEPAVVPSKAAVAVSSAVSDASQTETDALAITPLSAADDERYRTVYWRERGQHHVKVDPADVESALDKAADAIRNADALLFVTGAGMGCDMGLSDFRSSVAFWKDLAHPEIKRYEDASDSAWFDKDPALAWGINYVQLDAYRKATPHEGYKVLQRLAMLKEPDGHFCWTSNVDGVFQRLFAPDRVNEVHGCIHRLQCSRGRKCKDASGMVTQPWDAEVELELTDKYRCTEAFPLPHCPACGSIARPNLWFCTDHGNYYPSKLNGEVSASYPKWLDRMEESGKKVVVIECGAGLVIPSARCEAEDVAERFGTDLIRINPTDFMAPTSEPHGIGLPLGSADALRRLWSRLMSSAYPPSPPGALRIATLNVYSLLHPEDVADALRAHLPLDVLALQEVGSVEKLEELAAGLNMRVAVVLEASDRVGLSNALLVRADEDPGLVCRSLRLDHPVETRAALSLELPRARARFICTHLDHRTEEARCKMYAQLESAMLGDGPSFLMGDLNALRRSDYDDDAWAALKRGRAEANVADTVSTLTDQIQQKLVDCRGAAHKQLGSVTTSIHKCRIDYIWASSAALATWQVRECNHVWLTARAGREKAVEVQKGNLLTDHALVVCSLKLNESAGGAVRPQHNLVLTSERVNES